MSQNSKSRDFILTDKLSHVMWTLSWPAVLAMVLYGLNNFLDGVFVGRLLGNTALAAVGIAFPLSQIAVGLGSLIGTGAGSLLSIWLGQQDQNRLTKLVGNVNALSLFVSLITTIPAYIFAEDLIRMMGGQGEVAQLAVEYFKITVLGTFFWVHGLALNMMIRAEGKMKTAAVLMGLGLIVDIILKPLFISTFGWGVAGAAWATNASMMIYSVQGVIYFASPYATFKSRWYSFEWDFESINRISGLGASALILFVMMVVQSIIVFNALSRLGSEGDIAFYAATNRYFVFLLTPIYGLMRALQPVAGMNYGAQLYQRTLDSFKLFLVTGSLILAPFYILAVLFPSEILMTMMPAQDFSPLQLRDFRIYISLVPLVPVIFLSMSYFPAVGNGKSAGLVSILRQIVFLMPAMLILPHYFGISSIYWGTFAVDVLMVGLTFYLLKIEFKKIKLKLDSLHGQKDQVVL